ncbi:hypothetical protein [Burkholderia pyrrocinia]
MHVVPALQEGVGSTALEAQLVGVPVVASDRRCTETRWSIPDRCRHA